MGLNAHSDMDGRRFYNPESWEAYMATALSGSTAREHEGGGTREERMFERMMMGLRQTQGVDVSRFERDFDVSVQAVWPRTIADMTQNGLMAVNKERIRLTARGMQVMNGVLVALMEEMEKR